MSLTTEFEPSAAGAISRHSPLVMSEAPGLVQSELFKEARLLAGMGFDIRLNPIEDPRGLSPEDQARFDRGALELLYHTELAMEHMDGENPRLFYDPGYMGTVALNDGAGTWTNHVTEALALHPLYNADTIMTNGDGIDPAIFDELLPIDVFGEEQATTLRQLQAVACELMPSMFGEDPDAVVAELEAFVGKKVDPKTREQYQGNHDAQGVRTRTISEERLIIEGLAGAGQGNQLEKQLEDILERPLSERQNLVLTSLGCGTSVALFEVIDKIVASGGSVSEVHAIDLNPTAMVATLSTARERGYGDLMKLHIADLRELDVEEIVGKKSDVIEGVGLVEYFSPGRAGRLMSSVHGALNDDGVALIGNMNKFRPFQKEFDKAVAWMRLQQRAMTEMINIILRAGFLPENLTAEVPSNQAQYTLYSMRKPKLRKPKSVMNGHNGSSSAQHLQVR